MSETVPQTTKTAVDGNGAAKRTGRCVMVNGGDKPCSMSANGYDGLCGFHRMAWIEACLADAVFATAIGHLREWSGAPASQALASAYAPLKTVATTLGCVAAADECCPFTVEALVEAAVVAAIAFNTEYGELIDEHDFERALHLFDNHPEGLREPEPWKGTMIAAARRMATAGQAR